MVTEDSFKLVHIGETTLLSAFLSSAGSSLESFRYYSTRDFTAIKSHLITVILVKNGLAVGYGHLDKDGERIWLGIAVSERYQQLGYGSKIMRFLTSQADNLGIKSLDLSVGKGNLHAISLYKKFGFRETGEQNGCSLFMKRVSE